MALTRDNPRTFDISDFTSAIASGAIYEGAAVALVNASGLAIGGAFDAALHRFAGFAKASAADGERITLQPKGRVIIPVTGATDASANAVVYASDDNMFSLTAGGIAVGRIAWHQGATVCVVEFDAAAVVDAVQAVTGPNGGVLNLQAGAYTFLPGAGAITSITYNSDGTIATYTKAGTLHTVSYNASGYVSSIVQTGGVTITPTYDANNNVTALAVA